MKFTFQTMPKDKTPNVFHYIKCHMVFNIKMEDFHRKAHLVWVGHMTHTPDTIIYFSVVIRETVHSALTIAALYDPEVKAADVLNAHVMASNREKVWTVLGLEFGDDAGKSAIILRALYSLESTGASFIVHLAQCMQELGYEFCNAYPDLWMKVKYRPEDKLEYYSYISFYMDDILCIHHDPGDALNKLNGYVLLKPSLVGSPNMYLGIKLKCMQLHNGIWALSISPYKYI